jgi:hypothetical protein
VRATWSSPRRAVRAVVVPHVHFAALLTVHIAGE